MCSHLSDPFKVGDNGKPKENQAISESKGAVQCRVKCGILFIPLRTTASCNGK